MTIEIRKASRKKSKLRLGISAPSGAGKTMGALLLAYGIAGDWGKIGMIDTEEGSGELYVGVEKHGVMIGDFLYTRISKDFSPEHYKHAIHAMEKAGASVIIVDSLTHAWDGENGLLDKQGKLADKSGNSYTAWRTITPQHNALVGAMLQSPCHIIATMRSKTEYAMQDGDNGKKKVVKLGMAPIQRAGMEYEFTVFFDIDSSSTTTTTKDRTDLFSSVNAAGGVDKKSFIITPETGEQLLNWLNTGVEVPENEIIKNIKGIFNELTLPNDNQGDWVRENIDCLHLYDDERLQKVYNYLVHMKNKLENENE